MQREFLVVLVCVIIGAAVLFSLIRGSKQRKIIQNRIENGTQTKGYIFAVKPASSNESYSGIRENSPNRPIAIKLSYESVDNIVGQTILTHISRTTPNLHPYIAGAVGISSIGLGGFGIIKQRHEQMKQYREKLLKEGKTSEEVNKIVMNIALKMSDAGPGGLTGDTDSDGFLLLPQPIPVDVFIDEKGGTTVVFDKSETEKYFANQNFFE